jgi:hypothetical protein
MPLASMDPIKDSRSYGGVVWKECVENWKLWQEKKNINMIMTQSITKNHHFIEKKVDFDDGVAGQGSNLLV